VAGGWIPAVVVAATVTGNADEAGTFTDENETVVETGKLDNHCCVLETTAELGTTLVKDVVTEGPGAVGLSASADSSGFAADSLVAVTMGLHLSSLSAMPPVTTGEGNGPS